MINIVETKRNNLCFIGDIHGAFNLIPYEMKRCGFQDTAWVFCGDIGIGFEKEQKYVQEFKKIEKTASQYFNECYFFRGNHDNPKLFTDCQFNTDSLKLIPDYTVIKTPSHNVLCIGGATSVDRVERKACKQHLMEKYRLYHRGCSDEEAIKNTSDGYWSDEQPYFDDEAFNQMKEQNIMIDIVATHTCPSFAFPSDKNGVHYWMRLDENLVTDLDNERKTMDDIYNRLLADGHPLDKWIYGHFHKHHSEVITEGEKNSILFLTLDMARSGFDIFDCR